MHGILIDPKTQTITENDGYNGDYRSIYSIIGCDMFDIVHIDDSETVYVDDEGLINGNAQANGFFYLIGDNPIALAGKGLILGANAEGETIASAMTLDQVKTMVRFGQVIGIRDDTHDVEFLATDGMRYPLP